MTLGVLYNPWTGESTREWIMDRIAGGDGDGLEELEAELDARPTQPQAATAASRRSRRPDPRRTGPGPAQRRLARERLLERAGHEPARRRDVVGLEQHRAGRRQRRAPGPVGT